jgi:hypothetical protein
MTKYITDVDKVIPIAQALDKDSFFLLIWERELAVAVELIRPPSSPESITPFFLPKNFDNRYLI